MFGANFFRILYYVGWLCVFGAIGVFIYILNQTEVATYYYFFAISGFVLGLIGMATGQIGIFFINSGRYMEEISRKVDKVDGLLNSLSSSSAIQNAGPEMVKQQKEETSVLGKSAEDDVVDDVEDTTQTKAVISTDDDIPSYDGTTKIYCDVCDKKIIPELHEHIGYKCPKCMSPIKIPESAKVES